MRNVAQADDQKHPGRSAPRSLLLRRLHSDADGLALATAGSTCHRNAFCHDGLRPQTECLLRLACCRMNFRIVLFSAATTSALSLVSGVTHAHPTGCLPQMVRNALAKAEAACGITVISTLRRGARIAGTERPSKHASCRAAAFTSRDYGGVRRVLANYPGAMSTDPFAVGHVHIDDGKRLRFAHGGRAQALCQAAGCRIRSVRAKPAPFKEVTF